jgi:2-dehydro-3-deoxyphosphogluconate aldolase/(4S)-4-hydroxy-2-oxoglutarate aldolase
MAKYSRIEVAIKMKETGIVPVFYHGDAGLCKQVIKACYDGGIRVFEFTNRGDFASLVFAEVNKWVLNECPGMIMGVGSILDAGTASMYIALGANFIVSPLIDEGMASVCNKRKILWSPGCGSVTEIGRAHELGAEVVKIFPGQQVGGPEFVKAVLGPMPWSSIMPTGGVSPDEKNLTQWFNAGVHCVGMGSQLFPSDILKNKDFNYIAAKCREALEIVRRIRS